MEEGQVIFVVVIGGLLLLLLIGMIWDKIRFPKELKMLISAAQVLGLAYEPENPEIIKKFGHLNFLDSLSTKAVRVLSGQIGNTFIYLFFLPNIKSSFFFLECINCVDALLNNRFSIFCRIKSSAFMSHFS